MSKENPFVFTRSNCEVVSEFARSNSLLKQTMNSGSYWNRITILNGAKYDKDMILELVMKAVYPHELYPCMYREEEEDTFFLFKNGFSAVMALCTRKLFLVNPETDENIELTITAQYISASELPIDPMKVLEDVILKRIKDDKRVLDLRSLGEDPEMVDLYCSFNCRKFWEILLAIRKKHMPTIHSWILSHNKIVNLDVLDSVSKYLVPVLDLRHNQITIEGYKKISKQFIIGHLLLEGNPITADFETAWSLIKFVKTRVEIKKLDFLNVDDNDRDLRCWAFPTYIIEPAYKSFVDHFLFHSFKRFEMDKNVERKKLALMYHENATYSVSLFKPSSGSLVPSNSNYLAVEVDLIDHNLICDSSARKIKKYDNILFGRDKIARGLTKVPEIEFGYSTFSVDVPVVNDKMVQIFVNGVCRSALKQKDKQYYFSRSTFLVPSDKNNGEWLISNDMWNISHVNIKTSKMNKHKISQPIKGDFAVLINPQLKERDILFRLVKKMTKMKPEWVQRFLEESDWDLEFTLQSFTDQFKADVIPVHAFDIPEEKLQSLYPLVQALKYKQKSLGIETM